MNSPKISIVILNWNGLSDTIECLESVKKIDYPDYETIVVDNGSSDGSSDEIARLFPEVVLIRNTKNLGFAGGNNVGIKYAMQHSSGYILLLNNDTVVDAGIIRNLVCATNANPSISIFGCKAYYYSDKSRIYSLGARWDSEAFWFDHIGNNELDEDGKYSSLQEADFISGCAIFFNRTVVERIGMLDTKYFLNYEETDWCYRARKKAIRCAGVPNAVVWHKVSVSFGGQESPMHNYFMTRNELLWARKNLPFRERMQVYGKNVRKFLPNTTSNNSHMFFKRLYWDFRRFFSKKKDPVFQASVIGIRDFIFKRYGNCPKKIQYLHQKYLSRKING